jgi:hypothetical protein
MELLVKWGKRPEDVRTLTVARYYERLVVDGRITYRPTNRYLVAVQFYYTLQPRRACIVLPP